MYKLSSLPIEILYMISGFLETKDLITLARLNTWFSYRLSPLLSERIYKDVESDGWRIHIDILAKSYPIQSPISSQLPYSAELLLLGEYARINPYTLTLEFSLYPLDEEGFGPVKTATQSDRSTVLFNRIKTNIDIVAYFAQISSNRQLQYITNTGTSLMNDKNLWRQLSDSDHHLGMTVMGSGFKIQYNMSKPIPNQDQQVVIDSFKNVYNKHFKGICDIELDNNAAIISFDKLRVSPEWWIKQMDMPLDSSSNMEQELAEHCFW